MATYNEVKEILDNHTEDLEILVACQNVLVSSVTTRTLRKQYVYYVIRPTRSSIDPGFLSSIPDLEFRLPYQQRVKPAVVREVLCAMPVNNPREFWQEIRRAEEYERVRFGGVKGNLYRYLEERAVRKACAGLAKGSRILDVPVGTGRITSLLIQAGYDMVACDIARPMMMVAKGKLDGYSEHIPFVQGDVCGLPFPSNSFDAVVCIGLLMHQDTLSRLKTLTELARISKRLLVLQYGCTSNLLKLKTVMTGRNPGDVRFTVMWDDIIADLTRSCMVETGRYWVCRPFSSSVVLSVEKRDCD